MFVCGFVLVLVLRYLSLRSWEILACDGACIFLCFYVSVKKFFINLTDKEELGPDAPKGRRINQRRVCFVFIFVQKKICFYYYFYFYFIIFRH
jgi:hypothetical protein